MDNDLNKIELFSQSHDFKYFDILSDKAKKLMIEHINNPLNTVIELCKQHNIF